MAKERIDQLLVDRNLMPSRHRAKAEIMAGRVLVDDIKVDKAGTRVPADSRIRLIGQANPFVSRGGLKLDKAIQCFDLSFEELVVADIGASTGGFTDVALQNGAKRVYAVDVGYGQLAWRLRQDERVVVMERTNARYLEAHDLGGPVDFVVTDVSFIGLSKIFPAAARILKTGGQMVALIKPQFEAGREHVGKHGVVRDHALHPGILERVAQEARTNGFDVLGFDHSPIRGQKGNIEYLLHLAKRAEQTMSDTETIQRIRSVCDAAHKERT